MKNLFILPIIHVIDFEGNFNEGVQEYGIISLKYQKIIFYKTGFFDKKENKKMNIQSKNLKDSIGLQSFKKSCWHLFISLRKKGIFAGHYTSIENYFLNKTWSLLPLVPNWFDINQKCRTWGPWIDTYLIYKKNYPNLFNYKLMYLIKYFQLDLILNSLANRICPVNKRKPHCALYDALATALLLKRFINI